MWHGLSGPLPLSCSAQCLHEMRFASTPGGLSMTAFIEPLESRQLLSANPVGVKAPPETIAADEAAITASKQAIIADKATWAATLKTTRANIPAVAAEGKALIKSAIQAVRDARGNPATLLAA